MDNELIIKDLEMIRRGYINLAEHGADTYRLVGKDADIDGLKSDATFKDVYERLAESLSVAIKAVAASFGK